MNHKIDESLRLAIIDNFKKYVREEHDPESAQLTIKKYVENFANRFQAFNEDIDETKSLLDFDHVDYLLNECHVDDNRANEILLKISAIKRYLDNNHKLMTEKYMPLMNTLLVTLKRGENHE